MMRLRDQSLTRRVFLEGSTAILATSLVSLPALGAGAKFRRFEISDPNTPSRVLESYKKAISKMLKADPADPRNWYRNAFVHVFDCPHGNWWFLPWHRGYLGWFERICREMSEDPDFALPYWDWTKTPRVPAAMFEGVLDPNNGEFIASRDKFRQRFEPTINTLWPTFSTAQTDVLAARSISNPSDFLVQTSDMFYPQPNARGLTSNTPNLDPATRVAVSIQKIKDALNVPVFSKSPLAAGGAGFASDKAQTHNQGSRKGILESQPHDNVHGALGDQVGGFMVDFLSPVDPIFFLHHANLDRLWDVWTRRQIALHRATLPTGADLTDWSKEQFLFFSDTQGHPVSANTSSADYAAMTVFDYEYAPGSGEEQVPPLVAAAPEAVPKMKTFSASISEAAVGTASASVELPAALLKPPAAEAPPAVADVTLDLKHGDQGRRFSVLVALEGAAPIEAGAITVFGHHVGPTTFSVPLPPDLAPAAQATANIDIRVVPLKGPKPQEEAALAAARVPLTAVSVSVQATQ